MATITRARAYANNEVAYLASISMPPAPSSKSVRSPPTLRSKARAIRTGKRRIRRCGRCRNSAGAI